MTSDVQITQEFDGPVDLTNCDREPIHLLGTIQSVGYLIAVSSDWIVSFASDNLQDLVGRPASDVIGLPLSDHLPADLVERFKANIRSGAQGSVTQRLTGVNVSGSDAAYDVSLHVSGSNTVIEFEPAVAEVAHEHLAAIRGTLIPLKTDATLSTLAQHAADSVKELTGFDRVMIYRFLPDDAGEVIAEARQADLEPFLGLRYPASDIPKQARELYVRNPIRCIADINSEPVPIVPQKSLLGDPLDLSHSFLRSVSPIHIEYLQNMGVGASMSISLIRDGKLWGLIACHHMSAKFIPSAMRDASEIFGQMVSLAIDNLSRADQIRDEARALKIHNMVLNTIARHGSELDQLAALAPTLLEFIKCDGLTIYINGESHSEGATPSHQQLKELSRFLNSSPAGQVLAREDIASVYPPGADFQNDCAGLLAIPISRKPRDYLMFFRREIPQVVHWAGKPEKNISFGPNGPRLSPRKSFEAYTESVRGRSEAWSRSDLRLAQSLRTTLLEVVLRLTDEANEDNLRARERQDLLVAELNHRVRNLLTLVQGIIGQSRRASQDLDDYATLLQSRITALGRAHDQITKLNWGPASLSELVEQEARAYGGDHDERVTISGPDALINPSAFSTMALVVHELMTNANKYGALSAKKGSIDVTIEVTPDSGVSMTWKEKGGPQVSKPETKGFGSTIIERTVPHDLGGVAEVEFQSDGLWAQFVIPPTFIVAPSEAIPPRGEAASGTRKDQPKPPLPRFVLIVEDNALVAISTEAAFEAIGVANSRTARSVEEAIRILQEDCPGFALLDLHLGNETSYPVADKLSELGIPFAFATGYGVDNVLEERYQRIPHLLKPFELEDIRGLFSDSNE